MISIARIENVPDLNRLVNSAYRGDSSRNGWTTEADLLDGLRIVPEEIVKLIQKVGSAILIYKDEDGAIIGCVNLQVKGPKLYLGMFAVAPQKQGLGIGKALLMAADDFARERGIGVIQMTVISVREELISWYKKNGFEDTGEREPFPPAHPDSGIPRIPLEFMVLEKTL